MTTSELSRGRTVRCPKCREELQIELKRTPVEITHFENDSGGIQGRNELLRRWLWGIGALLILLSLASLTSFPLGLAFPFLLIAGLSLLPPVWQLAEEWWAPADNYPIAIRAGLVMLAIAVSGLLAPFSGNTRTGVSDAAEGQQASSTDRRPAQPAGVERATAKSKKQSGSNALAKTTSATVIQAKVVPFRSPSPNITVPLQMVITTWKNTGTTPIRVIEATFTFRDAEMRSIGTYEYTLYAELDSARGVPPGGIYTTPKGEGFIFPKSIRLPVEPEVKATSVDVTIRSVLENAGM